LYLIQRIADSVFGSFGVVISLQAEPKPRCGAKGTRQAQRRVG
jgi:hypothetical protein